MFIGDVDLHEPATLAEAGTILERYGPAARVLAGGTDLLVDLKAGRAAADHLISLRTIDSLHGLTETDDGLRIGALTTITRLDRSPVVRDRFRPLLDATSRMAAPQIRNVATVGGNIVSAVPCADLPPILTAMNAAVVTWSSRGQRTVPLDAFFHGVRRTALQAGEVLTAVVVPRQATGFGAAYARFGLREGNAIAVAGVAASVRLDESHVVRDARVVLGAVSPTPKLVCAAAELLTGRRLDDDAIEEAAQATRDAAEPISDIRGSADFRREIVLVMATRALRTARQRATESTP